MAIDSAWDSYVWGFEAYTKSPGNNVKLTNIQPGAVVDVEDIEQMSVLVKTSTLCPHPFFALRWNGPKATCEACGLDFMMLNLPQTTPATPPAFTPTEGRLFKEE